MKLRKIFFTLLVMIIAVVILLKSDAVRASVADAIVNCLTSVVPSLMTFMIVATFISNSACSDVLGRLLGKPIGFVFNLPKDCAKTVVLSMLGGYPCGAKLISDMLNRGEIDTQTAQKMLRFCINASPAYVISAIGIGLFGSAKTGGIICFSHLFTAVLIGVLSRGKKTPHTIISKPQRMGLADCFVKSVTDSTHAMLCISGFTITFSTVLTLLSETGIEALFIDLLTPLTHNAETSKAVLQVLFDVVSGSRACIDCPALTGVLLCSAAVSLGGMSIWAQVISYFSGCKINFFELVFFRLLHAVLTATLTYIIINITDTDIATAYMLGTNTQQTPTGFVSTALFLLCCACFAITVDKNISLLLQRRKRK